MRRPLLVGILVAMAGAGVVATAVIAPNAIAATTNGCTPWSSVDVVYPTSQPFGQGAKDTSITLALQFQRCTFGTDTVKHYRLAVHNIRASGKTDVAVGLKSGHESGGIGGACTNATDRVYSVSHPSVRAGTTWVSAVASLTGQPRIWGDIHVTYPNASYFNQTNQCRLA
jgi:hypothetical protein